MAVQPEHQTSRRCRTGHLAPESDLVRRKYLHRMDRGQEVINAADASVETASRAPVRSVSPMDAAGRYGSHRASPGTGRLQGVAPKVAAGQPDPASSL